MCGVLCLVRILCRRCLQSYCLIGSPAHDASQEGSLTENAYEICAKIDGPIPTKAENKINIIQPGEITEGATIGSGNFGDVKAGMWNKPGSPPTPVALKTLRDVDQVYYYLSPSFFLVLLSH